MVYNEIKETLPLASKYSQVFFNTFTSKKINTERKISNIKSLIDQLKKDSSIENDEYYLNGKLQIGKNEEINIMSFFVRLLDRKEILETHINGYITILK
jgi:UV DNA damage repair endonuclease